MRLKRRTSRKKVMSTKSCIC